MNRKIFMFGLVLIILLGATLIVINFQTQNSFAHKTIDEKRQEFVNEKDAIIGELIAQGEYACCLKKPCTYCIEKTPGHGKGATCNCLADIVEGRHPCGECIGEILEGHGNLYLTEYFAASIAEEVGEEHLETLEQIIAEKYNQTVQEKEDDYICETDQQEGCEQ
ncbi:hypothetical protein KKF32_00745 [Patescibacteria group bacterium]|nr:hypothetical protein [Patescibacteria group bacterium]